LPADAFERATGPNGVYYTINYELVLVLGAILEFKMFRQGNEISRETVS
jgi:hypothetical protein